jgi:hypothetical protein
MMPCHTGLTCPKMMLVCVFTHCLHSQLCRFGLSQVVQGYDSDPLAQKIIHQLAIGGQMEHYRLTSGLLRFKG